MKYLIVSLTVLTFIIVPFAQAHEGHGDTEVGEYDLDKPREVSPETAAHIGLRTEDVTQQPVEDVIRIIGVVKAKPNLTEIVSAKIDSQVSKIDVQVGDKVSRGNQLVSLARADGTLISLRLNHLEEGIVTSQTAIPGRWVEKGEQLFEVSDYRSVYIEGQLPESLLQKVVARKTNRARIYTGSDKKIVLDGTIKYISPRLDPVKRTASIIVEIENRDQILREEMWVDLILVLREVESAVVVPRSATITYGPMHFVFVKSGSKYQKQDINPGVTDDRYVEVLDGLFPGDEVVVQGAYSLTQIKPK